MRGRIAPALPLFRVAVLEVQKKGQGNAPCVRTRLIGVRLAKLRTGDVCVRSRDPLMIEEIEHIKLRRKFDAVCRREGLAEVRVIVRDSLLPDSLNVCWKDSQVISGGLAYGIIRYLGVNETAACIGA